MVSQPEPFARLKNQGMILGADNRKMSKRWGNVVNPDDIVRDFGADTLRVYEMFMGPFEQMASWSTDNLMGSRRFVEKVWRLSQKISAVRLLTADGSPIGDLGSSEKRLETLLHKTIKQVTSDINNFNYNTVVSALMILANEWEKEEVIPVEAWQDFLKMLAPFAPHITEELWSRLESKGSIHLAKWPEYDEAKLASDSFSLVVQINGKTRETIIAPIGLTEAEAVKMALNNDKIKKWVGEDAPRKVIYIPNRLLNLVV
jgi:leucyl-tRNA synthetase